MRISGCLLLVMILGQLGLAQDIQPGEQFGFEWMYRLRAYPLGYIPAGAGRRALQQRDNLKALQKAPAASATSWTAIGPLPLLANFPTADLPAGRTFDFAGSVQALAVDPRDKNTVYLGGSSGGVWKTTDGGNTWTSLTDDQPWLPIGSFAIDPTNPNTVYAGTGWPWGLYGDGILKTTNAGATWTYLPGPFAALQGSDNYYGGGAKIRSMAVSPTNGQIVLAAAFSGSTATQGIYRSTDGGTTWTRTLTTGQGASVFFYPDGNTAYASLGFVFGSAPDGVYKSTNGGQTWSLANGSGSNSLPTGNIGDSILAPAPSQPATMYISLQDINGVYQGFFKTTDGGATWAQMPPLLDLPADPPQAIAVQQNNPNVIMTGSHDYINRSTDGGVSWVRATPPRFTDNRAYTFSADGARLYIGDDAGIYSTDDPLATFTMTNLNHTLPLALYYPGMSLHPTDPNVAFAGAQDLGIDRYKGTQTWDWVFNCDGGSTAIDFTTPSTVYATCQRTQTPAFIIKSTSNGDSGTWNGAQTGIDLTDIPNFIPPITMDPSNSQRLYYGARRVYQTTNGGAQWQAISPQLTTDNTGFYAISTMAVAPSNPNYVYAGTAGGIVYFTANATAGTGSTWQKITAGLPNRAITAMVVHPTIPSTAYIAFSGFSGFGDKLGHIFKTTNSGANWVDISGNLPNTPLNDIVVDPDVAGTLYIGSDIGVFTSTTDGTTWAALTSGMPAVIVHSLRLHRGARILRAATFGRGMYDLAVPLAGFTPSISAGGLVNGASFKNQSLAAGAIASVFGTFGVSNTQATQIPLNTTLANVSVLVNGELAPLFFVGGSQINFQVPWTFGSQPEPLVVSVNGVKSAAQTINAGAFFSPGIFTINSSGGGQGAVQIANSAFFAAPPNSIAGSQSQPVARDQYVTIYCTGLGDVMNRPANGAIAPDASSTTKQAVTALIGGMSAPVSFAGLAPGFVALYQVNALVPANAPTGSAVSLTIGVGGVTSNSVTIAVQ